MITVFRASSGSLAMFAAIRRAQMLWFFGNAQEHFEV
jgi:hypothetical protein